MKGCLVIVRRRCVTAAENDVHTRWRHLLVWTGRPGSTAAVKRRSRRRERREGKAEIRREQREAS